MPRRGNARPSGNGAGEAKPSEPVQSAPARRRPALRAVITFGVLMGLFYAVVYTPKAEDGLIKPYLRVIASTTAVLLNLLGQDAQTQGTDVSTPGFSVRIARGCEGLEPAAAFIAAVMASPVRWRLKLLGVIVGTACLLSINFVRIVSLFFIGLHFPRIFDMMHYEVWQAAFIVLAIVFWAVWVRWATTARANHVEATT